MTFFIGNKGFIGVSPAEAVYGTPLVTTDYLRINSESLDTEPGNAPVPTIQGLRAENTVFIQGESMMTGNVVAPFGPIGTMRLLGAAIGQDFVAGSTPTHANTLASPVAVGDSTCTLTSATGYTAGMWIQITSVATPSKTEVHKILSVATNTITLQTGETFHNAFAAADTTATVVAPYTHTMLPNENDLPSLTVEKALATLKSLQFAGTKVNKFGLKLATNAAAEATYDLYGQPGVIITPTVASYAAETPFAVKNITASIMGSPNNNCKTIDFEIDNGVKGEFTLRGANAPVTAYSGTRKITGTLTVLLDSVIGMGYYTDALNGTQGDLNVVLSQGAGASCTLDFLNIQFGKPGIPLQLGANIVQTLPFTAYFVGGAAYDIQALIANGVWLPYV